MSRLRRGELVVLAALILTACAQPSRIQPVQERPVIRVSAPEAARPIQFQRIVVKMKRGTEVGEVQEGLTCTRFDSLLYGGGRAVLDDEEFTDTFRRELEAANYRIVGDPDSLFDDPGAWQAEYLVAGMVNNMRADICYQGWSWDDPTAKGEAFIQVNWEVYSGIDRKVAFSVSTQGSSRITEARHGGDADLLPEAFAQATRNLLADRRFHDLIAGEGENSAEIQSVSAQALETAVPMPRTKAFSGSIAKNSERVRQGVVTILVAAGHGSGFFINDAGHLLTNAHVVRGIDRAKVVLAGGKEATGNVLARDPRRDVALLKVDLGETMALPLRAVKPAVGAEVYAMGSPLDPSLSATLSKGIVSAYRSMDGLDFIQSDVNVMGGSSGGPLLDTSGNVIGMTVSGIEAGDVPMGLNYFIPIGDALSALGIGEAVRTAAKPATAEPVNSAPATSAAAKTTTRLAQTSILSLRLFNTGLQQNMPNIRASLAAVSVGTASGRGFFIDTKGHLLTNAHIVGSAKEVQVRLNSGGEFRGSVIAVNPRLDLALVKVAETGGLGLPLQFMKPKLGTPIYAVGAVDGDDTSIVRNRGVVVYRTMDDMQIVKSLMSAQPAVAGTPLLDEMGNALGIAVDGLFPNEPGEISFFVTIADALQALGVGVAS